MSADRPDLTSQRAQRADALFAQAMSLPPDQWPLFLMSQVGDDIELVEVVLERLRARGRRPPGGADAPEGTGTPSAGRSRTRGETPAPEVDPWLHRKLGEFELVERIGRGGMGLVFKAKQESLGRFVAVKVLPATAFGNANAVARFAKEASVAGRLHHAHLAAVHAVGHGADVHWFAMEYVDGPDLAKEVKRLRGELLHGRPRLPPKDAPDYLPAVVKLVAQAADGLDSAHAAGVIHRDIKPHNLLVDPAGDLRIVDFGLAHDEQAARLTKSGDAIGTPHYMSPEQVRRHASRIDARTDVYSLGVVLYELLTLTRPFDGKTSAEIWWNIVHRDPVPLKKAAPRVPHDLALICTTAMQRDAADRYATAAALRDDLRRFLAHESVHARAVPLRRRALRLVRRHAALLIGAAVALLLAVGAFAFAWSRAEDAAAARDSEVLEAALAAPDWDAAPELVVAARRRWLELAADPAPHPALRPPLAALRARFESDLAARLARQETLLMRARGGQRRPDQHGGAWRSPPDQSALAELLVAGTQLRTLYGDRPDVLAAAAEARAWPQIEVVLDPATIAETGTSGAEVSARAIEPLLGTRGPRRELGRTPLSVVLPPGNWRIIVELPGFGFSEHTRDLVVGPDRERIIARVRRGTSVSAAMKRIGGGRYTFDRDRPMGCDSPVAELDHEPFAIDLAETSFGEFITFMKETGRTAPRFWQLAGYRDDWRQMNGGVLPAEFLELPAFGLAVVDAQACAEWAGKRLPTHLELERALRGVDGHDFPGGEAQLPADPGSSGWRANIDVDAPGGIEVAERFGNALRFVAPVRDDRFRQPPEQLFHAFGNVAELTESHFAEPYVGDLLATNRQQRACLGAAFDARRFGNSLRFHMGQTLGDRNATTMIGLRCARSIDP